MIRTTIVKLFEEQVQKTPNNIAIRFHEKTITYLELNHKANQVARYLRREYQALYGKKLPVETLIGIYFERGINMFIAILGILKAGAAYVPLDPLYPAERIKYMVGDSKVALIISQELFTEEMDHLAYGDKCIYLDSVLAELAQEKADNLDLELHANNLAYIIYTSGSTGKPKGALLEHKGVVNLVNVSRELLAGMGQRFLQFASICFDMSVWEWSSTLLSGKELITISVDEMPPNSSVTELLAKYQINIASMFPSILAREKPRNNLPHLHFIDVGGESLTKKIVEDWGKARTLFNLYGPTETTAFSTMAVCKLGQKISIGKAIANTTLFVLDEDLKETKVGEIGELYIGGVGLARGYLNRADLTAERFITYNGKRVYKTGDLVRELADGNLEFIGRNDSQVKIRGFRIELGEIEKIIDTYAAISQAVVATWENQEIGKVIVCYYTTFNNVNISEEGLREHIKEYLPDYMMPTFFVKLLKFPLLPNSKINRKALPPPIVEQQAITLSANKIEAELISIWSKVLGIPKVNLNIYSNFFALGGHSLIVSNLMLEIEKSFHQTIDINKFLLDSTVANLARIIADDESTVDTITAKFSKDVYLEVDLVPVEKNNPNLYKPKAILLTGATGFLGVYLLQQFIQKTDADIYCLIRANSQYEAREKLVENIRSHKLSNLGNNPRIKIVVGYLEKILLGINPDEFDFLAQKVDAIFHCGAMVHHLYDYNKLRAANVSSVKEIIKLASMYKNKAVHYISTISAISDFDRYGYATENGPTAQTPRSTSGYVLTKWIAERLIQQAMLRGFSAKIYRPGNITGDSEFGTCNAETNHILLLLKGCIELQIAPNWDAEFELLAVDVLAAAITNLSLSADIVQAVFNLQNPHTILWRKLIQYIQEYGFVIDMVEPKIWYQKISKLTPDNALYPLLSYYLSGGRGDMDEITSMRYHRTQKLLQQIDIEYPKYDREYIFKILDYLCSSGFLPSP